MVDYRWRVWVTVWHMSTCDCDNLQVLSELLFFFPSRVDSLTTNVVRKSHAHCITTGNKKRLVTEYESLSLPFSRRWYLYVLVIQVCSSCTTSDNIRPFPVMLGLNLGARFLSWRHWTISWFTGPAQNRDDSDVMRLQFRYCAFLFLLVSVDLTGDSPTLRVLLGQC